MREILLCAVLLITASSIFASPSTLVYRALVLIDSVTIGTFTVTAGTQTRNINTDDLLTIQQGDARYARVGAATPTPVPTPVGPPQYFGTVTLVNGNGTVTFATPVSGCRVTDRSGNSVKYGPTANAAVWQFSGVGPVLDYECR